jgi:hypothetical protein
MSAWMKSPTHRANILARQYEDVGFSVAEGKLQGEDTILIVQEFGARDKTGTINPNGTIDTQLPPNFGNLAEVKGSTGTQNIENKPLLDIGVVAKTITFILLSALLIALVLDFIIIEKKKIPRVVGNNLDHIILITIFVSFLLMAKLGKII